MSMVINRRHIILATLVVALAAAIFIDYKLSGSPTGAAKAGSTLGQTVSVSAQASATDYFAQQRLQRTKTQDMATSVLKQISSSSAATATQKTSAVNEAALLAKNLNTEFTVESLIEAKGFTDCICLINDNNANVVVKPKSATGLSAADSAQIYDIVLSQTKFAKSNIEITPKN